MHKLSSHLNQNEVIYVPNPKNGKGMIFIFYLGILGGSS
jgi:hypothetical protein